MGILNNGIHAFPFTITLAFLFTIIHVFHFTIYNRPTNRSSRPRARRLNFALAVRMEHNGNEDIRIKY